MVPQSKLEALSFIMVVSANVFKEDVLSSKQCMIFWYVDGQCSSLDQSKSKGKIHHND